MYACSRVSHGEWLARAAARDHGDEANRRCVSCPGLQSPAVPLQREREKQMTSLEGLHATHTNARTHTHKREGGREGGREREREREREKRRNARSRAHTHILAYTHTHTHKQHTYTHINITCILERYVIHKWYIKRYIYGYIFRSYSMYVRVCIWVCICKYLCW
jgi:hypothetical protein